jgi:hypothetical protein
MRDVDSVGPFEMGREASCSSKNAVDMGCHRFHDCRRKAMLGSNRGATASNHYHDITGPEPRFGVVEQAPIEGADKAVLGADDNVRRGLLR